jgi:uncharacterized protein GlcG (DUF336 family)
MRIERLVAASVAFTLVACGGGGGSNSAPAPIAPASASLSVADVERIVVDAVAEARARGLRAHVAVVDRVGNVLATFRMEGAPETVAVSSGLGVVGGLDGIPAGTVPAALAAISKAITGAYLSSQGNAFGTRTAGQIVQEHFNPQEHGQPSGPLYGVQFSQLPCSDIMNTAEQGRTGPKRSPLGLSADPGGLPLYKDGVLVGGVGVEADGVYGLDRDIVDVDQAPEELVAVAGARRFAAPADIRGDRITADGRTFRFVDSESLQAAPGTGSLASLPGALVAVQGYSVAAIAPGIAFDDPAALTREVAAREGYPWPPLTTTHLRATEVQAILARAVEVASRTRAQIRRPLGSAAQVNIAVVGTDGELLGFTRSADAPVFGIDVSVQKARTALFFSHPRAFDLAAAFPDIRYVGGDTFMQPGRYLADARTFLGEPLEFSGLTAWSTRAIGNLHRPFYPDGLDGAPRGPLSTPIERWSPFNVGFQLDAIYNGFLAGLAGSPRLGCSNRYAPSLPAPEPRSGMLRNGPQIFPGGVPIYRGSVLIGAIGVSGDGVDQDDMIAYLAIANASRALGGTLGHAPADMRPDRYAPHGARLRYVQCPQAPFVDSAEQNACAP